jgi:hypothetical protein
MALCGDLPTEFRLHQPRNVESRHIRVNSFALLGIALHSVNQFLINTIFNNIYTELHKNLTNGSVIDAM